MDSVVMGAVRAVVLDRSTAAGWFDTIIAAHQSSDGDWDRFTQGVQDGRGDVGTDQVENFVGYVADNGGMGLVGQLAALGTDELLTAHDSANAAAPAAEQAAAEPAADYWSASVEAYGAMWAGFNGTEQSWTRCRDRFYTDTNGYAPDAYAVAYRKLSPLDVLPMAQRVAALQSFGFPVPDIAVAAATPPTDPLADLVAAHGNVWAAFTGDDASWAACRDNLYRAANAIDPQLYAQVYQRVNALEGGPMPARIAALRELGFTVTAQPVAAGGDGLSAQAADDILSQAILEGIG